MAFIHWISENLTLPLSDILLGKSISKELSFLLKSQFWTRTQIDDYQNDRLRKLIIHAYQNVPYYQDLFNKLHLTPEDIQTKEDLVKLPITTKEDLKINPRNQLAQNLKNKDLLYRSSSGSTGEPFQFYKTRHSESFITASALRGWYWNGYRLGDKYVKVSMNPRSGFSKKVQDWINNCLYLSAQQLTHDTFDSIADEIIKYNPKFIRCYPVPLEFLSDRIKLKMKYYSGTSLTGINTTGSILKHESRKKIEEIFNTKIFDAYSCEGSAGFFECPDQQNYHPSEEYAIPEFITDNFTHCHSEKPLRHITTDLHNYATPFIRYDTQDYLILGEKNQCSCGRNYHSIKKVLGRDSDILVTPTGKYLIVENFVAYFEWIPEVEQIQIVQQEVNKIIIRLKVNGDFNGKIKDEIQNYWNNYIGDDVDTIIELVDEITLTPTGKRRTVIRNPRISING